MPRNIVIPITGSNDALRASLEEAGVIAAKSECEAAKWYVKVRRAIWRKGRHA